MSTIYMVEHGSCLRVEHQQFLILKQKKLLFKVPANQIENIIIFGYCHLSYGAV